MAWAAWGADKNFTRVQDAFVTAAGAEQVTIDNHPGTVRDALAREEALMKQLEKAPADQKAAVEAQLTELQKEVVEPGLKRVNDRREVKEAVETAFFSLFIALLGYAICFMPTITLTNSLSFRNLSDPDKQFGSIRVLGTIGWIIAGWIVGFRLFGMKDVSTDPLWLAAGASAVLGVFCLFLPHTPPSGKAQTLGESLGLPALAMLKDRSFLVFAVSAFLINIVLSFYYQQANPFLTAMNLPYPVALQTLGQVSEIFFMLMIPIGLAWVGTKWMLVIGMLAWCLRYAAFATQNEPLVVGIGLPLHGICFDFFFVVAYLYVDRLAPKDLRASAQGLITFIMLGIGWFIGNLIAGAVLQLPIFVKGSGTDWTRVWLVPLAGSLAATALFVLLFREPKQSVKATE